MTVCAPDGDLFGLFLLLSSTSGETILVVTFFVFPSILFHLNTLCEKCCQRDFMEPTFIQNTEVKNGTEIIMLFIEIKRIILFNEISEVQKLLVTLFYLMTMKGMEGINQRRANVLEEKMTAGYWRLTNFFISL